MTGLSIIRIVVATTITVTKIFDSGVILIAKFISSTGS